MVIVTQGLTLVGKELNSMFLIVLDGNVWE